MVHHLGDSVSASVAVAALQRLTQPSHRADSTDPAVGRDRQRSDHIFLAAVDVHPPARPIIAPSGVDVHVPGAVELVDGLNTALKRVGRDRVHDVAQEVGGSCQAQAGVVEPGTQTA